MCILYNCLRLHASLPLNLHPFIFPTQAAIALTFALFMNVCIVSSFASAFYNTDQAGDAGFLNAGTMLGDHYGRAFQYIWAIGLFATGLSSTTAAVYAGQAIMNGFIDIKVILSHRLWSGLCTCECSGLF